MKLFNPLGQEANTLGYTQENFGTRIKEAIAAVDKKLSVPFGWANTPTIRLFVEEFPVVRYLLDDVRLTPSGYDDDGYFYRMPANLWQATPKIHGATPFRFHAGSLFFAKAYVQRWIPRGIHI